MEHARVLEQTNNDIFAEYHEIMAWLGTDPEDLGELLDCSMRIGLMNYKVMEMLDHGETATFGHPEPTTVNVKPVKGKCILVSGHDLHDLEKSCNRPKAKALTFTLTVRCCLHTATQS